MSFKYEIEDGVLVVEVLDKRATIEISRALKDELLKRLDHEACNVVIDLQNVEFVDSTFLGALVAGLKKATMKNGDLRISGLQEPVRAMFELTRLYKIFDIFNTQEEAIKSF